MAHVSIAYIKPETDYTLCCLCSNLLEYCACPISEVLPIIRAYNNISTKWAIVCVPLIEDDRFYNR